jgi:hypothetical protein
MLVTQSGQFVSQSLQQPQAHQPAALTQLRFVNQERKVIDRPIVEVSVRLHLDILNGVITGDLPCGIKAKLCQVRIHRYPARSPARNRAALPT